MKKILLSFLVLASLLSCKKEKAEVANDAAEVATSSDQEIMQENYGSWVGDFVAKEYDENKDYSNINKITIILKKITKNEVLGQSIVAGNVRPFSGTMETKGGRSTFTVVEPGDNKYDGTFEFSFSNNTLVGTWRAKNRNIAVTMRTFELLRQNFVYNKNSNLPQDNEYIDYQNPKETQVDDEDGNELYLSETYRSASEKITDLNASNTKLEDEDLKNLQKLDLEIIRNAIFARHGYSFKKKTFRQFFDSVSWYVPISTNVDAQLTSIEKENIVLLKRFEKYATDNYESFGR